MILTVGMKVKPRVPGSVVRYPNDPQRRLRDEGDEVPETGDDSLYWHRLILSGDIVRLDAAPTGREPVTPVITR